MQSESTPRPMALSPAEAARLAGVGRTTLYIALGTGELKSFKIGRRRIIRIDALEDWLKRLETANEPA